MGAEVLSRRGIVGFLTMLAAAPKAVEAQAMDVLRERFYEADSADGPSQLVGGGGPVGRASLTPEQLLLKPFVRDIEARRRRRVSGIRRCRSMSAAAKQAYITDAQREGAPVMLKWAKSMGWCPPDDDGQDAWW